jgi:hypothetical protein
MSGDKKCNSMRFLVLQGEFTPFGQEPFALRVANLEFFKDPD